MINSYLQRFLAMLPSYHIKQSIKHFGSSAVFQVVRFNHFE